MRSADHYISSLEKQQPVIYSDGARIESRTQHAGFAPTLYTWGLWLHEAAEDPNIARHFQGTSMDGKVEGLHTFWTMPSSRDDLLENLTVARLLSQRCPTSGYATIGRDILAGLKVAMPIVDRANGTDYEERLDAYIQRFQAGLIHTSAAVTDPKGDRRLRPSDQVDPDMYLHVVDRSQEGIVVRGCKMHTSGAVAAEELIVLPQRAMTGADTDYAVAFAIPVDAPGLQFVARSSRHSERSSPLSSKDALLETMTIFEDVFVPWDRVFMCGEAEAAGPAANAFATINRQGYLGTDVGKLDLWIGLAFRLAEANGVVDTPHVRDKLAEMVKLQTLVWGAGLASSLGSTNINGVEVPDAVAANAGKLFAMEAHYSCQRLALEIAGGATETLPAIADQNHPDLARYFEKYYKAVGENSKERTDLLRLAKDVFASEYAGWWNVEIIHGSGSPAAEKLQLVREYPFDSVARLVSRV
jgi:aromatic ring hydroxylase